MLLDLTELSSYLPLVSSFEFGNASGKLFPCTEGRVRTIMVPPGTPRGGAFVFSKKSRYHIARGHRKTACLPIWDLFVRLRKPLLNVDYSARRSICAFSAVEGMWAVRADCVVLRWLDECDRQDHQHMSPPQHRGRLSGI